MKYWLESDLLDTTANKPLEHFNTGNHSNAQQTPARPHLPNPVYVYDNFFPLK